jgi:hypothetical protein
MYLHIGRNTIVNIADIIGIFDIETASTSKIAREYLSPSKNKEIISVSKELPKSFIVCRTRLKKKKQSNNNILVYISQISSSTLKKRLEKYSNERLTKNNFYLSDNDIG